MVAEWWLMPWVMGMRMRKTRRQQPWLRNLYKTFLSGIDSKRSFISGTNLAQKNMIGVRKSFCFFQKVSRYFSYCFTDVHSLVELAGGRRISKGFQRVLLPSHWVIPWEKEGKLIYKQLLTHCESLSADFRTVPLVKNPWIRERTTSDRDPVDLPTSQSLR